MSRALNRITKMTKNDNNNNHEENFLFINCEIPITDKINITSNGAGEI